MKKLVQEYETREKLETLIKIRAELLNRRSQFGITPVNSDLIEMVDKAIDNMKKDLLFPDLTCSPDEIILQNKEEPDGINN